VPRALIIEPAGNLWGAQRALLDLIEYLDDIEVAVCCPPARPLVPEIEKRKIRLFPYCRALDRKSQWQRLRAATGILRGCLSFRPDVLYLNQVSCYRVALSAAVLLGLPIVGHVRELEDAACLARARPSPRRLHGLIAASPALLEELRSFPELAPIPMHCHYDGYVRAFEPLLQHVPERSPCRIACIGRVAPDTGEDVLVEAVGLLRRNGEDVECWMMGDGERVFVERLLQRAADVGAASRIAWLGTRDGTREDIVAILRTCTALVCLRDRGAPSRAIFEAWDAGAVPIVWTQSGGAEIVTAADAGILYHEGTPQALAAAIRETLHLDREEMARLVANGRAWLAGNCDARRYGAAIAHVLRETCSEAGKSS
jgi:glycosyltransferase involved in cell wall biosynthesis